MDKLNLSPISLYNFLANIILGFVFTMGLMWGLQLKLNETLADLGLDNAAVVFLVLVSSSFVLGAFIHSVSSAVFELFVKMVAVVFPIFSVYSGQDYWRRMDRVGRAESGPGEVLAKIAAEVSMFEGIFFGAVIVMFVTSRDVPTLYLVGLLSSLVFAWAVRKAVLVHRIDSFERALGLESL